MEIFTLVGKMALEGQGKVQEQLNKTEETAQKVSKGLKVVGAAFTAIGVAGLAMIASTKKINAALGVTAINLGVTTKEMRDLTLATTNVTFPIEEVTGAFDMLARAGVKDTEVLQRVATAFDTLGDAIGMGATKVTEMMVPAMKTFGLTADEMAGKVDSMTYLTRQTTMSLEDFNTMVGYTTPELVAAGLTMDDLTAILIHMEKQGFAPGRVMTREFQRAVTLATKEQIPLTEAIGLTSEELAGYKDDLAGATGMTQEYAEVANEQYTLMDNLKQKWSELTLGASGFLEPLEPILAGMTALGPIMMALSMTSIPKLIGIIRTLGHSIKVALAFTASHPVILGVMALIAVGVLLWQNWDKVVHFFKIAWINIKIFFLTGVEAILEALAKFTSWIPVLGDEIEKAHRAISDMIDSEEVRKDAIRVERALELTEKAMDETTEAAVEMEESIAAIGETSKETAEILEGQAEAVDELKKSYEGLRAVSPASAELMERIATGGEFANVGEWDAYWAQTKAEVAAGTARAAYSGAQSAIAIYGLAQQAAAAGVASPFYQSVLAGGPPAGLQEGGIAMRPMIANIAEKVPEVVAPLDKLKNMLGGLGFGGVVINIDQMVVREEADINKIGDRLVSLIRRREGLRI